VDFVFTERDACVFRMMVVNITKHNCFFSCECGGVERCKLIIFNIYAVIKTCGKFFFIQYCTLNVKRVIDYGDFVRWVGCKNKTQKTYLWCKNDFCLI
jgi:hypothetical protein